MLRALGFKKGQLASMITIQSLSFSGPGVALGMISAWLLNYYIRFRLFYAINDFWTYQFTTFAICLGIIFGFVAPLISNWWPIKAAMGKNLRQSLDLSNRDTNTLTVVATRLEDISMSFS